VLNKAEKIVFDDRNFVHVGYLCGGSRKRKSVGPNWQRKELWRVEQKQSEGAERCLKQPQLPLTNDHRVPAGLRTTDLADAGAALHGDNPGGCQKDAIDAYHVSNRLILSFRLWPNRLKMRRFVTKRHPKSVGSRWLGLEI
jgi:hypothetical protein